MSITKIRGIQIKDLTLTNQQIDSTAGIEFTKLEHVPLAVDGFNSPTTDIDWGNYKITNLGAPVTGTDAARKAYVDSLVTGLFWKDPARFMIQYVKTDAGAPSGNAANLEVCINTNDNKLYQHDGTAWVELTLVDGDIFVFGKNGTDTSGSSGTYTADNKVYTWSSSAWSDSLPSTNEARLMRQESYEVDEDTGWTYNDDGTAWVQFTGAGQITAGPGLAKTGNQIYVENDGIKDSMIDWGSGANQVNLDDVPDGTSYERVAANQLTGGVYIDATTSTKGIASFNGNEFSVTSGAVSIATDGIDSTHIDWGTGANQVSLDDVPDGTSYERVAANQLTSGIYIDATTTTKGIASFDTNHFSVASGAVSIATDSIDDTLIDFGTGANQVNAADIPLTTAVQGQSDVQNALQALETQTTNLDIFKTISVSGQDNIVADGNTDTLTFVSGTDITITTDSTSGAVTISSSGSSSLSASLGVERVGDDFRADLLANGGISLNGNELYVNVDDIIDITKGLENIGGNIAVNVDENSGLQIDSTAGVQVNLNSSDALEFSGGAIQVKADGIKDTHIDWGTGAGQVNAADIPLTTAVEGQTDVQNALQALETGLGNVNAYSTISVSGQDDLVANGQDTLTFVAGNDVTITTDSTSGTLTIDVTGADNLTASLGVERVGDDFRADLLASGGLALSGNELYVNVDDIIDTTKGLENIGGNIAVNVDENTGLSLDSTSGVQITLDGSSLSQSSSGIRVAVDGVNDTMIDFGTGANQVNASDIPLTSAVEGQNDVQAALTALESATDALDIFKTISVSGQDNIVADGNTDTLTFVAGTDITITTDSTSGALTISSSGSSSLTASLGVERVGDDFRADLKANGGLRLDGNEIEIDLNSGEILYNDGTTVVGHSFVIRETPSGTINGVNTIFTLANTPSTNTEQLFLNGVLQEPGGEDYTISGDTITMVDAPISGDRLKVNYISA